jgi:sugar lactone lactonase YvrE
MFTLHATIGSVVGEESACDKGEGRHRGARPGQPGVPTQEVSAVSKPANPDLPSDTPPGWWANPAEPAPAAADWWSGKPAVPAAEPAPVLDFATTTAPAEVVASSPDVTAALRSLNSTPAPSAAPVTLPTPATLPQVQKGASSLMPILAATAAGLLLVAGAVVTAFAVRDSRQPHPPAVVAQVTAKSQSDIQASKPVDLVRIEPTREEKAGEPVKEQGVPVAIPPQRNDSPGGAAPVEETSRPPQADPPQAPVRAPVVAQREEPKVVEPAAPVKLTYKRRQNLSEEDLRKMIAHAPEVALDRNANRVESEQMVVLARQALVSGSHADVGPTVLKKREDLRGLPMRMGDACKISPGAAEHLQGGSVALRANLFEAATATAARAGTGLAGDTRPDPAKFESTLKSGARSEQWQRPESVPALMQLLMPENESIRLILVEQLAKIPGPRASAGLANRAVYDLNPEVRLAALEALKDRPASEFRQVLLDGLRYPLAVINDHAAEALVALKMLDSVPTLVAMLDEPTPTQAYEKPSEGYMVREVVRVNHLHNCLMCHAPSFDSTNDKVRGLVPNTNQPLPPAFSNEYYAAKRQGVFVRADITYLQQDFSVPMPVTNYGLWPSVQRYDFMVRERHATLAEIPAKPNPNEARQPTDHEKALFFALRELTGQDPGPTAEDWKRLFVRTQDMTRLQTGLVATTGVAADPKGVVYVADAGQQTLTRLSETAPTTLRSTRVFAGLAVDVGRNRLLVCHPASGRIVAIDLKTDEETVLFESDKQQLHPRYLVADKRGGIYFSTQEATDSSQARSEANGAVHYLSAQGTLTRLPVGVHHPRGLALAPDERTLYVVGADSLKVLAYPLESAGVLGKGRVLATLPSTRDDPVLGANGLAVDAQGNLYVAHPARKAVQVLNSEGARLGLIPLPEAPLFCSVGGVDQKTLYITTATEVHSVKVVTAQSMASIGR